MFISPAELIKCAAFAYVEADTVNGVVEEEAPTEYCTDVVDQDIFYASLKDMGDDEMIGAYLTKAMYDKIKAEYGIRA